MADEQSVQSELETRVALVTGADRGIGRAIILQLARSGYAVAVHYHHGHAGATELKDQIISEGHRAMLTSGNVTMANEVSFMFKQVEAAFGQIDILVNNAGVNRDGLLMRMSDDNWDTVLDTDLKGAFLCTRAVLRGMIQRRWGRIINISSVVGLTGNAGQANYAAAKGGLDGLTRATAREVASRGITVNSVAPGFIVTDMTNALTDAQKETARQQIPMQRFGQPEDVAALVVFLAGDAASYITGQVISVNGGMFMG